jgi:hypothetical protein
MLPNINFKLIMNDPELSDNSKKTIWKYLQLILFIVCNEIKDKDEFGDANYLFEAIKENDLHEKIKSTMDEMKEIFMNMSDVSSNENIFDEAINDISGVEEFFNEFANTMGNNEQEENNTENENKNNKTKPDFKNIFETMMDADKFKEHLSGIMDGKIGTLAKELAEEAATEFGIDENMDENKQKDFFENLLKNPNKFIEIIKNIGEKLKEKFSSGELKKSELYDEVKDIMGKMKDMPGLKNMMKSMGMNTNGKFDFKGMASKMSQSMKQEKMKEQMQEKLRKKKEQQQNNNDLNLGNITEISQDTFLWNDDNSNPNTPLNKKRSNKSSANKKNKNKKKGKKAKN